MLPQIDAETTQILTRVLEVREAVSARSTTFDLRANRTHLVIKFARDAQLGAEPRVYTARSASFLRKSVAK
jgi:hypothetical protein